MNHTVTFSETDYSSVYEKHITELQTYEKVSAEDKIVSDICASISEHGR